MTVFLLTFDDVSHFILTNQTSLSMGIEIRHGVSLLINVVNIRPMLNLSTERDLPFDA